MKKDVERYWSDRASAFDHLYALPPLERLLNRILRRAVYQRFALTLEHAGDLRDKRVLDVGCGSGRYAVELARRGAAEVVGVDFSAEMLRLAQELAAREGLSERTRFVRADFDEYRDAQGFDVVIAIGFFDYVGDPTATLAHARELTRGRFLASFPAPAFPRALLRRIRYGRRGVRLTFYTPEDVHRLAEAAGFSIVQVLPLASGSFLVADR
jgi:2-polyprenyl-3-methyl-5-hydroxy-6-metoxy-1,4-benzoquinol methylase